MLLIVIALDLAALIGLCLWRPAPEPKPKPVCLMSPAELWELFAGLDADGSGDLDGDELGALLKTIGAVTFTHPLGFLLLVLAASTGVRACLRRGRRTLTAACVAANACAGARLAYHWNALALVCSIPFFLTAAAVGRLYGAERRSFGTVSLLSILMLSKAAPFLVVAPILVGVWLVEIWNSGYAWFVERWDDVEYWHAVWNWQLPPPAAAARSRDAPFTFLWEVLGFIPELCLWYAAIVALDLKVIWFLAEGSSSYPRVLGTGPAAEAMRCDLELKRGAPTPQQ